MSGEPVNLAEIYNARLAAEGSSLRWYYRRPGDWTSELTLGSLIKPRNRFQAEMDLDFGWEARPNA